MNEGLPIEVAPASEDAPASDEEVIARVKAGDTSQFEILMRRHNRRLYRVVRAVLREEADVEDAMQQAYVAAFEHLDQFAGASKWSTWLCRIAINEALGHHRRGGRFVHLDPWSEPDGAAALVDEARPDPERQAQSVEVARTVEELLDELPAIYRAVFVLRELEDLDVAETADVLGVSPDVVKTRLRRARLMLQSRVSDRLGAAGAFPFGGARCDRVVARVLRSLGATVVRSAAERLT